MIDNSKDIINDETLANEVSNIDALNLDTENEIVKPNKVDKNERFTKSPLNKIKKERRCKNKAARKSRKVNRKK